MANTLKFGAGQWATKEGSTLAYNDENDNYKPLPFTFTRASNATVVNKAGLIETVGNGIPRIDFLGNTQGALLLEPQRTNSITYSNDLSQSFWSGDIQNSVYGQEGFNGTNDAWLYTKLVATANGFYNQSFTGTYTVSFFVKKEVNKGIQIYNFGDTSQFSKINLENGTYISGVDTVKIEEYSSNWFRVSQTLTVSNGVWYFYITDGVGNSIASSLIVQYFQIEQGSYATSYIPTQGSAVTRLVDSCSQTPPDGVIGQTEGSIFIELDVNTRALSSSWAFSLNDGTTSNYIGLRRSGGAEFFVHINVSGTTTALIGTGITSGKNKISIGYASNNIIVYVNGVNVGTDTSSNIPTTSDLQIGNLISNRALEDSVSGFKLYNTRLSNAELQALTT